MANISYEILYTPVLPLQQEPFEYLDGTGTFKIRLEPSVGNSISDFNSGFIRIKNAKTENNVLVSNYKEQVIPFSNSKYGNKKNIIVDKLRLKMPYVSKDKDGYYVALKKIVFGEDILNSKTDIKDSIINQNLSVQICLTKDIIATGMNYDSTSTIDIDRSGNAYGILVRYNEETEEWDKVDFTNYFNGDILAKGISSWSAISTLNVLTETKYKLVHSENEKILENINSPVTEFYGIRTDKTPIDNINLKLKKFKIEIFDNELENKQLIDSSDWVYANNVSDLQIIWQNKKELVDRHRYLVRLTICNYFNFYKQFDYQLKTVFQKSNFKGNLKVVCNHDLARNEIELKVKSPLLWGPDKNVDLDDNNFIKVDGEISVEQGINLTPNKGGWSGEFIFSGINPTKDWEEHGNDYFLKLQTSEPTNKNPYQYIYTVHALSMPTSYDVNYGKKEDFSPYEDDILWNPILKPYNTLSNERFQLFLDSSDDLYDSNDVDTEKNNRVLTLGMAKTKKEITNEVLYVREYDKQSQSFIEKWWEILLDKNGKVQIQEASYGVGIDFTPKPIYLYDPIKHLITEMGVSIKNDNIPFNERRAEDYRIYFDDKIRPFIPGRSKRPTYINEFRLIKRVFNYSSGIKTEIEKQTYRAYLTGPNQKLMDWKLIDPTRKYYLHINETGGQIQLNIADITEPGREMLDRYNAINSGASIGLLNNQILTMRGLDGNSYIIERKSTGEAKYYNLSIDAMGIPDVDFGSLSALTITYEPLLNRDIGLENIQNGKHNDDFVDFDEIIADIEVEGELVEKDHVFESINDDERIFYREPLIEFANKLRNEAQDGEKIYLFATDQHLQFNRYNCTENVAKIYSEQYDAIDCMTELSNMIPISSIFLGGDNVDGCGLLIDTKKSLQYLIDKLNKRNANTNVLIVHGNHDYNTATSVINGYGREENSRTKFNIDLYNKNFFNREDYTNMVSMEGNYWMSSGCGYMIKDNTLFLTVDSSDSKPSFDINNNLLIDPLNTHGYSVNQLNQISYILETFGQEVDNIILLSHIPPNIQLNPDSVGYHAKNVEIFNQLLKDYNDGQIHLYGDDEDGINDDQAIVLSTKNISTEKYAKITLGLHGHTHQDRLQVINSIPHLECESAANFKNSKEYGRVERVPIHNEQRTCFKAIVYNQQKKTYKIFNFGFKSDTTIDNIIIGGDK